MVSALKCVSIVFFCSILILSVSSCTSQKSYRELKRNQYPLFIDDFSDESLLNAIDHHLNYLKGFAPEEEVLIGDQQVTYGMLTQSLTSFKSIIEYSPTPFDLDSLIADNFLVFEAEGRNNRESTDILLTGYYEPVFNGSTEKTELYRYPIYRRPDSLITRTDELSGKKAVGRLSSSGDFIPYWSRKTIETEDLLQGYELAYLSDPLDAYLLHVQGSGRIRFPDGSIRAVHFASSNGLTYNSLGKLFVDEGIMVLADVSIPSIREYFTKYPHELPRMLHHNPRYIFFQWGKSEGPKGSIGEVLTPGRSIAIDHSILPSGTIGYLVSRAPVIGNDGSIIQWKPLYRFVLPQDSGSAIKGAGRADLFWGTGTYAETAANHMKENGKLYFLLKNNFELPAKIR